MIHKKWIVMFWILATSFLLTSSISYYPEQDRQFIRFHVIANSDSGQDQEIKLKVRDRLLEEFGEELGDAPSIAESRLMIINRIEEMKTAAQEEVDKYLRGHHVEAALGHFDFPTKIYGSMLLPAGNYEALRITIGEAKGANWWCVMFPPLCFVDISHGVAKKDDKGKENIDGTNSGTNDGTNDGNNYEKHEAIADDLSPGDPSIPKETGKKVEYKFKFIEWWEKLINFLGF